VKNRYDVIVIGGGNAGLCAALSASKYSKEVLLIESGSKHDRGGNSKYTRDIRYMHERDKYTKGEYLSSEFVNDVLRVTHNNTNKELLDLVVTESAHIPEWYEEHGVLIHEALKGTLHLGRTNLFMMGGGKAMLDSYYNSVDRAGIEVLYNTQCVDLDVTGNIFSGVKLRNSDGISLIKADAVVIASGGFESNLEWLAKSWGKATKNFIVRGTKYNTGEMLKILMDHNAGTVGNLRQFHSVAVDARSPKYEGGIVTRIDSIPFGITVNNNSERFYDEGEDLWPKRYAIWGKLIAEQPDQIAFSIIDSKSKDLFLPTMLEPYKAENIQELAIKIELDPKRLQNTVDEYNRSTSKKCTFNNQILDDCSTTGLAIPKSHWARAIDRPPYYGYRFRPGITFTYFGVEVNHKAQVLDKDGKPFRNIFAAGEIMSGNILSEGYLAGFGLTIGTVFGIIAGREAVKSIGK
jgi:tricarballylate dehydrogenase